MNRNQSPAGGDGPPSDPKMIVVAATPVSATAAADATRTTHAIALGGRAAVSARLIDKGQFARGAFADLSDDVGRLVLRLVVGARHQLGKQAERDKLHAGGDQQNGKGEQRPV